MSCKRFFCGFLGFFFFLSSFLESKVYDCFCFNNEFEVLKIRLHELWDSVDHFVLVESVETQRGTPKPLYFEENKQLFEQYLSKIIHIKITEKHPKMGMWQRENFQRDYIMQGLGTMDPHDVVMISDLDEIPKASLLPEIFSRIQIPETEEKEVRARRGRKLVKRFCVKADYIPDPAKQPALALEQEIYFFQLNRQTPSGDWMGGKWHGTIVTSGNYLRSTSPQKLRDLRDVLPCIKQAGWHFTWMGGISMWRHKMRSVVEGSPEKADSWTDEQVRAMVETFPARPIDNTFPSYVIENLDYLKSIGYIADSL